MPTDIRRFTSVGFSTEKAQQLVEALNAVEGTAADSVDIGVVCAGTSQANARELDAITNIIIYSDYGTADGIRLPASGSLSVPGTRLRLFNSTVDPVRIYPATGKNFSGRPTNAPIYLAQGKSCEIMVIDGSTYYTLGEMLSNPMEHWVHVKQTLTNVGAFSTLFTAAIAANEGVSISGFFRGAYATHASAAAIFEGRFSGAASRGNSGNAVIANRHGFFQDGNTSDSTTLVEGLPPTTTITPAIAPYNYGLWDVDSSFSDPNAMPVVRCALSTNDLLVQARGTLTDAIVMNASFRITRFGGQ